MKFHRLQAWQISVHTVQQLRNMVQHTYGSREPTANPIRRSLCCFRNEGALDSIGTIVKEDLQLVQQIANEVSQITGIIQLVLL
jgi:hypothetical protein